MRADVAAVAAGDASGWRATACGEAAFGPSELDALAARRADYDGAVARAAPGDQGYCGRASAFADGNASGACDSENAPDCACRWGDRTAHYGGDFFCSFGDCFSAACAPSAVRDFVCYDAAPDSADPADDEVAPGGEPRSTSRAR